MTVWVVKHYDMGSEESQVIAVVDSEEKAKQTESEFGWPVDYEEWSVQ